MNSDDTNARARGDDSGGGEPPARGLARRLGLFDATMLVMGGIVGSGIFVNPHVVARHVSTPALILGAWLAGGAVALAGAFVYAELAVRRPAVGGQYAYLRDAYHPAVAFLYGWALLLVVQTGAMAAVAVVFGRYFVELTGVGLSVWAVASVALAALTVVNCLGVRAGGTVQSALMTLKIGAIVTLVAFGLSALRWERLAPTPLLDRPASLDLLFAAGAALTPVMFAYGGWQTSSFVAAEMRDPRRDLARGVLIGVACVILLYLGVNFVCVGVLGADGLAATPAPASAVMRRALGEPGARFIAAGVALSTLGFLSQGMLTSPRVYFAMAEDGLFFRRLARLSERTRAPVWAVALQGALAVLIAATNTYDQILNYVVSVDFIFFGLTGLALFLFRRRAAAVNPGATESDARGGRGFKVPGHPLTTGFFVAACWTVVAATVYKEPVNSGIGLAILLAGVPAYLFWSRRAGAKVID
ncbi:MAG: amino acid permease [Acidobacteria bacterium]|nr:amino acid permease [Acidobacteriota bacterium]